MTYTSLNSNFARLNAIDHDKYFESTKCCKDESGKCRLDVNLTGIVCTIGPACDSPEKLTEMLNAGMRIARLNFSHGDHESKAKLIKKLKDLRSSTGKPFAIALDTKGPEIRTGDLKDKSSKTIPIKIGSTVTLTNEISKYSECTSDFIYFDYAGVKSLPVGTSIFIDDGLLQLKVEKKVNDSTLECKAINSGNLGSRKGVNLPNVSVDLPAMTDKDKKDLKFGVEHSVDMVFASFIRSLKHVQEMREYLRECGDKQGEIHIIPKIENSEGLMNFDEILSGSDGIMAARGDMGIETMLETVPLKQKIMARKCNDAKKPYIVATMMLESMCTNPRATRAEVYDVNGAILDGASCVMLSGESAKGKYPLEAVKTQALIAKSVEKYCEELSKCSTMVCEALPRHPAEWLAKHTGARFIIAMECGNFNESIPSLRASVPNTPVIYLSSDEKRVHQSNCFRGMLPHLIDAKKCSTKDHKETMKYILSEGLAGLKKYAPKCRVKDDEPIVILTSCPGHYSLNAVFAKQFEIDMKTIYG